MFSRYIIVRKLPNSTSTAVCIELPMIFTELGLLHIIRNDNGPCYSSKEFQQFLQCYSIMHQTSSPNHPRSNGFAEKIVGVAKKLMDKAGSEGKPWISGLFGYRVTAQTGSISSPLQLMTQCRPREKNIPQLPSTLGAPEMHQTCQEFIRRQGNKSEREYWELLLHQSRCNIDKMQHGNLQQWYRSLRLVLGLTFFKIVAKNLPLITQIYGIEKL